MVKQLFSGWQAEADCMASNEKRKQLWKHHRWGRMVKKLFSRWQVEADCMASNEKHKQRWLH